MEAIHDALTKRSDTPASVLHRHLMQRPDFIGRVPEERTIRHLVRQWREQLAADGEDPWSLLVDETGETARLVQPVLREAMLHGAETRISKLRATWIARIRRAVPDLHPWEVYLFAARYEAASATKDHAQALWLDSRLALLGKRGVRYHITEKDGRQVIEEHPLDEVTEGQS